jgi:ketosteroid isomerase-like protein
MASTESEEVRALLDRWSQSIRMKDIHGLMSLYVEDSVYFDVVPPLGYEGSDAIKRNFLRWFESWDGAIGVELSHLTIMASGDTAFAYMLHRTSGILKGRQVDYWLRVTVGCVRLDGRWSIQHEHVSFPVDLKTESVVMDLVP